VGEANGGRKALDPFGRNGRVSTLFGRCSAVQLVGPFYLEKITDSIYFMLMEFFVFPQSLDTSEDENGGVKEKEENGP
jgi:hypothetical protein